ncbi:MAG: ATP-binding protein [Cyclobacteriaceae bacterium]
MSDLENPLNKSDRLEKALFEIICLMFIVVMCHGFVQGIVLFGVTPLALIEIFLSLLMTGFLYLSRFRRKFNVLRVPLVIILIVAFTLFWFWLSGYHGPTGVGAVAIGIITILLLPQKHRTLVVLTYAAFIVILVAFQTNTDWVRTSPMDYETLPYDYLVIVTSTLLIVNRLKSEFDLERRLVSDKNRQLDALNVSLNQSIKESKATLKKLEATKDQLIDSEKMASIGRLTAGIAHELNNPLNFIGGNVSPIKTDLQEIKTLLKKEDQEKTKELFSEIDQLLSNINTGAQKASDIINNLLKISPRGYLNESTEIHLQEIVHQTYLLVSGANPDISFNTKYSDKITLYGNSIEINQVLLNVIKNAIDAISENGEISLSTFKSGNYGVIEVSDNGCGIKKANRAKIFEPFFSTKPEGEGTGLGLFISYGIVKKHSGEIIYIPKTPGSSFQIKLPLKSNLA